MEKKTGDVEESPVNYLSESSDDREWGSGSFEACYDKSIWDNDEKKNTLGEWSDSDDNWVMDVEEKKNKLGEWSDSDDNWIWDVEENAQTGRGRKRKNDEVNEGASTSTAGDEVNEGSTSAELPENNFYTIEQVKQTRSKNFRMAAMDYKIRFNNDESELDLIQGYERTQEIFEHLLNDITTGMKEEDQTRFV